MVLDARTVPARTPAHLTRAMRFCAPRQGAERRRKVAGVAAQGVRELRGVLQQYAQDRADPERLDPVARPGHRERSHQALVEAEYRACDGGDLGVSFPERSGVHLPADLLVARAACCR